MNPEINLQFHRMAPLNKQMLGIFSIQSSANQILKKTDYLPIMYVNRDTRLFSNFLTRAFSNKFHIIDFNTGPL